MGVPTLASFQVRDRVYVVDVMGTMFALMTEGDDPDMWCWQIVQEL